MNRRTFCSITITGFGLVVAGCSPQNLVTPNEAEDKGFVRFQRPLVSSKIKIKLQVDGKTSPWIEAPMNATLLEVMQIAQQAGVISFTTKQFGGYGAKVTTIDTKASDWWIYKVGGKLIGSGVSSYHPKSNTLVAWQRVK